MPSLPPASPWRVDAARLVASSAPARAARRLSAPLARLRHHRDITLRARALLDAHPRATVQERVELPRRRLVAARAVVARLQVSLRLAPRAERARCLRASATTVASPPSRALCAVHHRATPETVPMVRVDVAFVVRAVVTRRRYFPSRELGAGSRRAPSERAACAPLPTQWPHVVARPLLDAHSRAPVRKRVSPTR